MYEMLNVPAHTNCRSCGECCGVIPVTDAEMQTIREFLKKHPEARALAIKQSGRPLDCPFRDNTGRRCVVYPVRPLVCRLCGITRGMQCANGNSMEMNTNHFLANHKLDQMRLLNFENWEA